MISARERLLALETKGFLFHGSPVLLERLSPRQPMIFNKQAGKSERHGNPCVATTSFAEIAIFRAIVNWQNFPIKNFSSSFGVGSEGKRFAATREILNQLEGKTGYVYVFSQNGFSEFSSMEWRSECEMKPLEIIAVSAKDLPENIREESIKK